MSFGQRSRTVIPLDDDTLIRGRAVGLWGMWQAIIVLVVATAGLVAAALYLHSGQPAWPPPDVTAPSVMPAALSTALAIAACFTVVGARRRLLAEARPDTAIALLATLALLVASIAVLAVALSNAPFRWDEHVYTSLHWTFYATVMTYHATTVLMVGAVLLQRLSGLLDPRRALELDNTILMVFFTTIAAIALLGVVHYLPAVTAPDGFVPGVPQVGPGSEG
jgi:heme/copper-type cytochrome/quinol oxidase subunit 3